LAPQGKLDVAFRALRVGDDWWLDCDADHAQQLAASLTRFRLRVKAEIDDVTSEWGLVSVLGPGATDLVTRVTGMRVPEAQHAHAAWGRCRVVHADWPDRPGVDVLGPRPEVDAARSTLVAGGAEVLDADAFEVLRIRAGIPRLGVDVDAKTIPQEAFYERDSVSFTKGCFLGQELVTRIDTRGHVNRYLRRVAVEGTVVPPAGATVVVDEREVGQLTSAAADPVDGSVVALAMVRHEVELPASVTIRWPDGEVAASVA
jgi:folate-binding protein YgfZ